MPATSPEQAIQQFSQHLNEGDLEGALALYEPDATFVPQPGQAISGLDAIRSAMTGEIQKVLEAKGTALVINKWTLEGTQPNGTPITIGGQSADVLRRQEDGTWRVLIDDPWGALSARC
jgi:uncharacterized protein (TIGR02246 family)